MQPGLDPDQRPRIVAVDHDTTTRARADELDDRYGGSR
jgi:hypothetical protein